MTIKNCKKSKKTRRSDKKFDTVWCEIIARNIHRAENEDKATSEDLNRTIDVGSNIVEKYLREPRMNKFSIDWYNGHKVAKQSERPLHGAIGRTLRLRL